MPLSFITPPGARDAPGAIDSPEALRSAHFLSAWSGPAVHGFASRLRVGGVFVESADVVLGIRAWNDAREGILGEGQGGAPYAIFEVEKIVRMMLHQSGLAFEILASPVLFEAGGAAPGGAGAFPARRILKAALTSGILHHYRDTSRGMLTRFVTTKGQGARVVDILELARTALTGEALMAGAVDFNLASLLEGWATPELLELLENLAPEDLLDPTWSRAFKGALEPVIAGLSAEEAALPERPSDYAWLNDFVVSARLEQRDSQRAGEAT